MKNMWIVIFLCILCFLLLLSTIMGFSSKSTPNQEKHLQKKEKYDQELMFTTDTAIEQTKADALEQYKAFPPLRPERFRRRVKMILGVDIRDYFEDALIWFGRGFILSMKYQTISGFWPSHKEDPYPQDLFSYYKMYQPLRGYLFYHDSTAYRILEDYAQNLYESLLREDKEFYTSKKYDILVDYDVLNAIYNFNSSVQPSIINYIELNKSSSYESYYLNTLIQNKGVPVRVSDIKKDLVSLFINEQMRQGKNLALINYYPNGRWKELPKENELWTGDEVRKVHDIGSFPYYTLDSSIQMKRNLSAYLSFLVQLKDTVSNKVVIQYMSGQLDRYIPGNNGNIEILRESIRSNNYYGYAVLREFSENPEREMPTLEKVGTSFIGRINNVAEALLYLEPFSDSYDIDTIRPNETFIAYEMGHDDYYFVEVVKPVESPIAGSDGYAMILDRTETVYGYMKRQEVREYADADTLSQTVSTGKSKQGIINDPDGYVNIRKEMNAQSEILGKIVKNEIFSYWETAGSNWYAVKTQDGILGFVHKDRIREKLNTGGWVILDDD